MNSTKIMNNVSRTLNRALFSLKKHSPEILVVTGVIGTVTSAVMACKATTKVSEITDQNLKQRTKIEEVKALADEGKLESGQEYTEEDYKKDLVIVYTQTAVKLVKLYAPSVILGALSITGIITSHNILRKRNVALAAAYATIDKGFKEYRNRVVERFGKTVDHELKYNIKAKEVEETIVNEKGEETTVTKTVNVIDPNTYSEYARFFDEACTGWDKNPEYNLMFLRNQQRYANDLLIARGHLFLNEVYDMLGIPRTTAGQVVGWIYNKDNPVGDNFVDFGIYDVSKEAARNFVNGYERTILLDFNVDGTMWDKI